MTNVLVPLYKSETDKTVVRRPIYYSKIRFSTVIRTCCSRTPSFEPNSDRQLPVILPHELIRYLGQHDLIPAQDTCRYWRHVRLHTSWGEDHPGTEEHKPGFLYGDDTKFSQQEKLCCICFGWTLDERTSSMECHHPLAIIRDEAWPILRIYTCTYIP